MDNSAAKTTRLVPDTPASADAFGSHQRVANAITEIVRTEIGGKTIGIEGGWGSGKSTVVNLFRVELQKDPNVGVVSFDAWVHEGDPLRRTFLETLIFKLQAKKWIDSGLAKKRLEELARRRKETNKISTPVLTLFGKALGLSAFLVPIGIAYMMAGTQKPESAMLWIGIAFTILPLTVLLISSIRKGGDDTWALFVQKTVTNEVTETIDTPEPTSIEFKTLFAQLMTEALGTPNRRLVIVVDNLDRVSPTEARSIWSVLRTFLEPGDLERPDWFSKLWVVVPYDPMGLEAMLHLEYPDQAVAAPEQPQRPMRAAHGFAASFIDKAIQIRFYVAPPVLKDWQDFLMRRLEEAFPDHDKNDSEFHLIYRLYAVRRDVVSTHPTPRDLILYVNEIGALHRQWQGKFRLAHMAYFALLHREKQDIQRGLLTGVIPTNTERDLLGTDISESLAALYFNVDVDSAGQLLLKQPVAAALGEADVEQIKSLAEHHRGFLTVLEHQLPDILVEWAARENQKVANAARALVNSGIIGAASTRVRTSFSSSFRNAVSRMGEWTAFMPTSAEGLRCLMTIDEDPTIAIQLARTVASDDSTKRPDLTPKEVTQWVEALLMFLRHLQEKGHLTSIKHKFKVPANAEGWLTACESLLTHDPAGQLWSWLDPRVKYEEITTAITQAIPAAGGISNRHLAAIRIAEKTKAQIGYDPIATSLETKLQANANYQGTELSLLLQLLSILEAADAKHKKLINRLALQGYLLHHFYNSYSQSAHEVNAWLLYFYLREIPAANQPGGVLNSQAGFQHLNSFFSNPVSNIDSVKKFIDVLNHNNNLSLLFNVLDSAPQAQKWIATAISELASRPEASKLFTLEVLEKREQFLRNTVDEGKRREGVLDRIVKSLIEARQLVEQILKTTFESDKAWLYASMVRSGAAVNDGFVRWCELGCSSVDKDRWLRELTEERELVELICDLCSVGARISLGVAYLDALADHGTSMAHGKVIPKYLTALWPRLLEPLAEHSRNTLRDRLLEAAKSAGGKTASVFFEHYGLLVGDARILRTDTKVVQTFFSPLVTDRNEVGLAWLATIFRAQGNFLEAYSPNYAVEDLKARLRETIAAPLDNDSVKNALTTIALALGVSGSSDGKDQAHVSPLEN